MDRIKLFRWQLVLSRLSSLAMESPAWYRPVLRQHLPCLFMCLSSLFVFCSEEGRSEGYTAEEANVIQRKKRRLYRGRSEDYTEEEAMFIQRKKRRVGLYLHVAEKLLFFFGSKGYTEEEAKECRIFACSCK